jgi:predicted NodU family carbamoyl transferase
VDGQLVAAVEEERFTRIKHDTFPTNDPISFRTQRALAR